MLSSKYWNRERYITVVVVFTTENAKKKNNNQKNNVINFKDSSHSVGKRLRVK